MEPEHLYVRVRPHAPNKGYHIVRLSVGGRLFIGGEYPRWYRVPVELAQHLATLRQDGNNPESKLVFEVASEVERKRIDEDEEALRLSILGVHTRATPIATPNPKGPPIDYTAPPRAGALPTVSSGDYFPPAAGDPNSE